MNQFKEILYASVKFSAAIAVIWGIGFAILTQSVSEEVTPEIQEADAVIWDANIKDGSEFSRSMAALGLRPRAYNMNGNVMYFAAGETDINGAYEAMSIIEEELINFGVNSKSWLSETPNANAMAEQGAYQQKYDPSGSYDPQAMSDLAETNTMNAAMLRGELVPIRKEKDYVAVAAINTSRKPEEIVNLVANDGTKAPMRDYMGGYRFIDATGEPDVGRTTITAVWTDEDFDAKKMDNRSFKPQAADPMVPACVGCEREFRVQSLQKDEPFRQNKWTAKNAGLDETYDFYQGAMQRRGWKESGAQVKLQKLAEYFPEINNIPGRALNLEKDGRLMNITLIAAPEGGTEVYSNEQYGGTQTPVSFGASIDP